MSVRGDADDQGDGSTDTWDDVGRSHQQATDELGTDLGDHGSQRYRSAR